jgi:uncharacterized membrane protein YphA (DoxX/SURF4 family)
VSLTVAEPRGIARLLTATVDPRPIAIVRVVIGLTAIVRVVEARRIFAHLFLPTTIRLPYVAWLPQIPTAGVRWLLTLWALAAVLLALGCWTRTAALALAATLLYVVLLDEQTYSNHLYLLALVASLLACANAGAVYSLDARRARAAAPIAAVGVAVADVPAAVTGAWAHFLLRTQVSATYAFSGLAKMNHAYLSGATMAAYMSPRVLAAMPEAGRLPLVLAFSWGAIALELWLAFALWRRRWRSAAVGVGVGFHAAMVALLPPGVRFQLTIFAVEMLALYVVFFEDGLWGAGPRPELRKG